jgi:hypothetical protein
MTDVKEDMVSTEEVAGSSTVAKLEAQAKPKGKTPLRKTEFELKREKDLKTVKGRFEFTEIMGKGAPLVFSYGSIYEDVPIKKYTLVDGDIYELPFMVAKHLNETGWYAVHHHAVDENGKPSTKIGQKIRRYGFFPIDFQEAGQNDKKLVTVERV